ncbi:hypothetical protein Tco_1026413 [Tanacetum coccineum]
MSTSNVYLQFLVDAVSETRPPMLEREAPRLQKEEDLRGDDLKHYETEIEAINLILISIPNYIYNSVDACTTAKPMWKRVERLMRGTMQNQVDRETRFNNEFDQFVTKPGEALVSLKYVTQIRLAKRLTEDSYYVLFDYLQQFEKLVNASRAKKLEKSHDPLALVAHTGSSSRTSSPYYVTHPSSVVDYDDDYQGDTNDAGNIQRTLRTASSGTVANDEAGVILTDEQNDFLFVDASRIEEIKELSANICLMARIQPVNIDSDAGPSYDSAFLSEYPTQPKIINKSIGDDQIDSNIIFDEPNEDVNSGSVENDNNVQDSYELEQLARNAYKEAEKQQIIAKKSSRTKHNADRKAKRFEQESQYQFIRDRDIIGDLEQQRDKLDLNVVELKKQTVELQKTQSILKRKMSDNEDKYHDTVLDLKAKVKNNVDTVLKIDIKEMKDVFKATESDLCETWKQNELLKDQLLEANLKHEIECCVLLSHECIDNNMKDEIEKVQRDSIEIQKGMQKRINILENDTSPNTQQAGGTNKNVIAPGMYKVGMSQVTNTNKAKSILSSIGLSATSSVRRPSNKDSSFKNSVISNTKNSSKKVDVSDRTNKNQMLILRMSVKSTFKDSTLVVSKIRFSVRTVQSKSFDTTPVVSKAKIVVQIMLWIVDSGCSKHMTGDRSLLKIFVKKFIGIVRFGNDHFAAITGYGDYVQGNIKSCHVYYVEVLGHNLFSV